VLIDRIQGLTRRPSAVALIFKVHRPNLEVMFGLVTTD
jgi:hypothetical protein